MRPIHKTLAKKVSGKSGSTMIFVLVLISILVFTAGSLMFTVYGSYTMSGIFGQSEGLAIDMSMVQSAITKKLEQRVNDILKNNVKIYNENNTEVSDRFVDLIFKVYDNPANNTQNKALFSDLGFDRDEVKNTLSDWIESLQGDNPEDIARRSDFSEALYDIDFRLHVWVNDNNAWSDANNLNSDTGNGILYPMGFASPSHTGATPFDVFDTIGDPTYGMVKPILSSNPVYSAQGLYKFIIKKKTDNNTHDGITIKKHLYGTDASGAENPDYAWIWLQHMCTTKPQPSNYLYYNLKYDPATNSLYAYDPSNPLTFPLLDDRSKNMKVDYIVKAQNQMGFDRLGNTSELQKTSELTYMFTSQGFDDNQLMPREVNLPTEFENDRFQKILITAGDLFIHGNNGTVNINGNVYAYGHMPGPSYDYDQNNPYSMNQNIVNVLYKNSSNQWKRNYGGIIIGSPDSTQSADGKIINIKGNVDTRAYVDVRSNNVKLSIEDNPSTAVAEGNVLADSIYLPMRRNEYEAYDDTHKEHLTGIDVDVSGNVSTYNDLNVGADNSRLRINGNYIGMSNNSANGEAQANGTSSVLLNNLSSRIIVDGEMLIGGLAYVDNITRESKTRSGKTELYPLKTGLSATQTENNKVYSYNIHYHDGTNPDLTSILGPSTMNGSTFDMSGYFKTDWLIQDMDTSSTYAQYLTYREAIENASNYPSDNELIYYFYDYLKRRESDDAKLALNFEPLNTGIVFNKNQRNFAPGIICAQGYQGSYDENNPPPGKFYYLMGSSSLGINALGLTSFGSANAAPLTVSDYLNRRDAAIANADLALSYIKKYSNDISINGYKYGANLNFAENKTNQLVDADYILESNNYDPVVADKNNFGDYYCYLTYKTTDLVFGDGTGGSVNISTINNKKGIIFTEGKAIFRPTSDFTFSGVVVALGGIEIDTGNSGANVTFNYDENAIDGLINLDNSFPESKNLVSQIRRFIAPGNKHKTILDTRDIYRNSNSNIQLVNKKYIKPY